MVSKILGKAEKSFFLRLIKNTFPGIRCKHHNIDKFKIFGIETYFVVLEKQTICRQKLYKLSFYLCAKRHNMVYIETDKKFNKKVSDHEKLSQEI